MQSLPERFLIVEGDDKIPRRERPVWNRKSLSHFLSSSSWVKNIIWQIFESEIILLPNNKNPWWSSYKNITSLKDTIWEFWSKDLSCRPLKSVIRMHIRNVIPDNKKIQEISKRFNFKPVSYLQKKTSNFRIQIKGN